MKHLKKTTFLFALCLISQMLNAQNEFISIWQSTNQYPAIEIPTYDGEIYDYNVNWGDGSVSNNVAGDISHNYANTGNYIVTITGVFPGINFSKIYEPINQYNEDGILSIQQWGNNQWKTMEGAFKGQKSLVINTNDTPDLSQCTNMSEMFYQCYDLNDSTSNSWNLWDTSTITNMSSLFYNVNFNKLISNWNVSNVTNMSLMFYRSNFNQPIDNWNVGNVINMAQMFYYSSFNQPIGLWNVSNVTNMSGMFSYSSFNQQINNWNVSKVTDMSEIFSDTSYNLFIGSWNVGSVTNMYRMFYRNRFFNQPIGVWNVSSVTNFEQMFLGCSFNQPLNNWNVGSAINMSGMFAAASDFNQDISNWNVSNVTNMSSMFEGADLFNQSLNNWNVGNVTDMSSMFANNSGSNFNQPLNNWDVSNVIDMESMFKGASFFNQDIGNWDTSKVLSMESMFKNARVFDQNINNWDVSNVLNMASMFNYANDFNQPLNNWDVSNVTDMGSMFKDAYDFNQNINNWHVGSVTNMFGMFSNAGSFNLPLNNWNVSNVTNMGSMFSITDSFNQPLNNWNVGNVTYMREMFSNAESFNQPLNSWDVSKVTNMLGMFSNTDVFNQPLNNWNVGSVTTMQIMFENSVFNYPLNNWDTSSVEFLSSMFLNAISFDQDISSWNVEEVISCSGMLEGVKLSNTNYEALLIGWNAQNLKPNVFFDAGNSTYFSNAAEAAKLNMINDDRWTIYDGGKIQQITWTGAVSTDWNTAGNWDTNSVPTATDDVVLADVANAPRVNFNQSHAVNNLTTNDALTIKNNASLTVNGDLDQGANIQVESFVNGNGSFILRGNQTNLNPADLIYLRYLSGNNWHLFASPVTQVDIDAFAAATQLAEGQNNNRGIGFHDNNANPSWSYYQNGADNTGDFISGKGYSIQTSANAFLNFTGKLRATDIENYVITDNGEGWNLVGNPYPANINANVNADANENFLTENADNLDPLFANIYLWNPSTTSYEPIGNGLGAKYIAPAQGFFIKSKNGGGTIDIKKSMLTHQIGNLFLKENQTQKIVLKIDDNTHISETTIAFKKGMTQGLDVTYDAAVFNGENRNLSLYTNLLEGDKNVPFAIQFLPELENNNYIIPLGIASKENSEITFSIKEINLSSDKKIYLEDKLENTFTQISNTKNYTLTTQKTVDETGRFFLHFQEKSLSSATEQLLKVKIYKSNKSTITILGLQEGKLNIYDISGKIVLRNISINKEKETINMSNFSTGVYFIEIKTNNQLIRKKIIF